MSPASASAALLLRILRVRLARLPGVAHAVRTALHVRARVGRELARRVPAHVGSASASPTLLTSLHALSSASTSPSSAPPSFRAHAVLNRPSPTAFPRIPVSTPSVPFIAPAPPPAHTPLLPRYAVRPGHEHKAFIPYNNVFIPSRTGSTPDSLAPPAYTDPARTVLLRASHGVSEADRTLRIDYLIYALSSHLPSPINLWNPAAENLEKAEVLDVARGTKQGGVAFLKQSQRRVSRAPHSNGGRVVRTQNAREVQAEPAVNALAGMLDSMPELIPARLQLLCTGQTPTTPLLRTPSQNVSPPMAQTGASHASGARVRRTLQLSEPVHQFEPPTAVPDLSTTSLATALTTSAGPSSMEPSPADVTSTDASEPATADNASESSSQAEDAQLEDVEDAGTRVAAAHIFAIGDAGDACGAVNAGHNASFQGKVAARNVVRLIMRAEREERAEADVASREDVVSVGQDWEVEMEEAEANEEKTEEEDLALEKYTPSAPAIKVSLGLSTKVYQYRGVIGTRDQEQADLDIHTMWGYFGSPASRDPRTACEWQSFVNNQAKLQSAFKAAFLKMSLIGHNERDLINCSEAIQLPPAAKSTEHLDAGLTHANVQQACATVAFPMLPTDPGPAISVTPVPLSAHVDMNTAIQAAIFEERQIAHHSLRLGAEQHPVYDPVRRPRGDLQEVRDQRHGQQGPHAVET
ncbi:uncharacterized protein BXZ73DRAFT_101513 [Epithele typhae]|uniref:uncharacterized protein n=1 Tax=Epithele typhae TaxID=378194 RepID=UPI002007DB2A|nr:uncharacterized protein BXZ73DRAFT_101513 [Epithele typhae]KAH9932142.1 hypothetical protein BXZ73DRAFT_101513 [Epithele typhae]